MLEPAKGIENIVIEGTTQPDTNLHIRMFDLLGAFLVNSQNLPGTIPYLEVDPDRGEQWSNRNPETGRPGSTLYGPVARLTKTITTGLFRWRPCSHS